MTTTSIRALLLAATSLLISCVSFKPPTATSFYELKFSRLHWYPASAGKRYSQHITFGERWKEGDGPMVFVPWVDFYDVGKASYRKFEERRIQVPVAECIAGKSLSIPLISYWDIGGEWKVGDPATLQISCSSIASWAEEGEANLTPRFKISMGDASLDGEAEVEVAVILPKSRAR